MYPPDHRDGRGPLRRSPGSTRLDAGRRQPAARTGLGRFPARQIRPASTRVAAISSIGDYIDDFYNLKRRHPRLAYMSPIAFELKTYVTALAA